MMVGVGPFGGAVHRLIQRNVIARTSAVKECVFYRLERYCRYEGVTAALLLRGDSPRMK